MVVQGGGGKHGPDLRKVSYPLVLRVGWSRSAQVSVKSEEMKSEPSALSERMSMVWAP